MSSIFTIRSLTLKIALGLAYKGTAYQGWQKQPSVPSVQERLELALRSIACENIDVQCAGRTDAQVHAGAQVVHFETQVERPLKAWIFGSNTHLPDDIRVLWARFVPDDFHARFSATARRYQYFIQNTRVRSAFFGDCVTHHPYPLDAEKMHQGAQHLLGEQDFSCFRAADCQSKTARRKVTQVSVVRYGDWLVLDIQANAFLHHMVRNIVGSLLPIGECLQSIDWIKELIKNKDRRLSGPTAKPNGLYLIDVTYPDHYDLPIILNPPEFLRSRPHELD